MTSLSRLVLLALLTVSLATPLAAQSKKSVTPVAPPAPPVVEEKPAPYDSQLMRLSEVLGSIVYLRTLCGAPAENWRRSMQQLLDSDTAKEQKRREKLTAAFNRGYRSFAAVHTVCTATAHTAEERYRNEGATLASEIAARFGN